MTTAVKKVKSRTIKTECNYSDIKHILENENTEIVSFAEGCLLDNMILVSKYDFSIGKKNFEYIILHENYVNSWTSNYNIIFTNDDSIYNEYYDLFESWYNENNKEEEV